MNIKIKETDLYEPVKKFFISLQYEVKSEVKNCDVVATKDDILVIVELKKTFNLSLLYQVLERQKITDYVYVCVPRPKNCSTRKYKSMINICNKLGVGVIFVSLDSKLKTVEVIISPLSYKEIRYNNNKKKLILKEMKSRNFDANLGGSSKIKLNTAFREKNIQIACIIKSVGPISSKLLIKNYDCEKNTHSILYNNIYGWYRRVSVGIYDLTPIGILALQDEQFKEVIDFYSQKYPLVTPSIP
jgi:hypothetical protein